MGQSYPQFYGFSQHDSQEFMTYLLDGVHEDTNRVVVKPYVEYSDADRSDEELARESWYNFRLRNQSVIVDLFFGMIKSTVTCPDCNRVSVTFDPVNQLSCPLPEPRERFITFYYVSALDVRPYKMRLAANRDVNIGSFLQLVSESEHVDVPKARLILAELKLDNYLQKIFRNEQPLSEVQDTEQVKYYVYAVDAGGGEHHQSIVAAGEAADDKVSRHAAAAYRASNNGKRQAAKSSSPSSLAGADWSYAVIYMRVSNNDAEFAALDSSIVSAATAEAEKNGAKVYNEAMYKSPLGNATAKYDENTASSTSTTSDVTPLVGGGAALSSLSVGNSVVTTDSGRAPSPEWGDPPASAIPLPPPLYNYYGSSCPIAPPCVLRVSARQRISISDLYNTALTYTRRFTKATDDDDQDWSRVSGSRRDAQNQQRSASTNADGHDSPVAIHKSSTKSWIDKYPFCVTQLNKNNIADVAKTLPFPPGPHKSAAAAAAKQAGQQQQSADEEENNSTISFNIPVVAAATRRGSEAAKADGQLAYGPANMPAADSDDTTWGDDTAPVALRRKMSLTSEKGLFYFCINLKKDYAENSGLFDRGECSRHDGDNTTPYGGGNKSSSSTAGIVRLHDCLQTFLQPEQLSEREMWYCKTCKDHKRAEKKLDLWDLPAYLIIHLKRFNYSRWWRDKLRQRVLIPEELDMSQYVKNPVHVKPVMYDFVAVSNHSGGLAAGHYWAHAKDRDGIWVKLNDSHVSGSNYSDAGGREHGDDTCYLVFFKLRGFQYGLEQLPIKITAPKEELDANAMSTVNCPNNIGQLLKARTPAADDEKSESGVVDQSHSGAASRQLTSPPGPARHSATSGDDEAMDVDTPSVHERSDDRGLTFSPTLSYNGQTPSPTGDVGALNDRSKSLAASPGKSNNVHVDKAIGPSPDGMLVSDGDDGYEPSGEASEASSGVSKSHTDSSNGGIISSSPVSGQRLESLSIDGDNSSSQGLSSKNKGAERKSQTKNNLPRGASNAAANARPARW